MPAPANFDELSRADQLAYLYSTYGGSIEDRQRAQTGTNVLANPRMRASNVATGSYVSPEERELWGRVKTDGGTWLGNALSSAAPAALGLGLAAAGGAFGTFGSGASAAGAAGAGAAGAGAAGAAGNALGASMGWDWGRVLDYAAPIVGGLLEGQGARDAAGAQSAASAAGIAESRRQYDQTRADQMPWLQAGTAALGRLNDPNAFTASPDYNFRRGEGMRGIENSFAARGGAASGNALRALSEFNSSLASGEYGNWYNRQAGQAGVGQVAAQNLGTVGANNSANIANLLGQQGDARASGITGQTNALTGSLQGLFSTWNRRNPKNTMSL